MKLAVLDYGSFELPLNVLTPGDGGSTWLRIGVPGYLIQIDDGRTILVDTGLPRAYVDDAQAAMRADGFGSWIRGLDLSPANLPAAQLARLGLAPTDVTDLVVTHTHFDHAGGMGDFPAAAFVVQRAERELLRPMYAGFTWPSVPHLQLVDGDAELAPGVRLLHTPGHTPGHMSVLVTLPNTGKVLLAIDAIYLPAVLERDNFRASWNEDAARESGHRVARLAEQEGAWLIYGHDPAQWASLQKAPAFYD